MKANDKGRISVIVPIYNTQQYLDRCLNSIINQSYQNLQIICIDDGSTDDSGKIADLYAKKDPRVLVIHQENAGESNARNRGLALADGEYLGFVDCDDFIEPDMYRTLLDWILRTEVDLAASGWYQDTDTESVEVKNAKAIQKPCFGKFDLMNYVYRRDSYRGFAYIWNKLYKRKLLYDECGNRILFDEELKLGGDVLFLARMIANTERACYIDKAFYHYYQRPNSGCHTENLDRRMDWLMAYQKVIRFFEETSVPSDILIWVKRFLAYHCSNVAELAYEQKNRKCLNRCQELMKKYKLIYFETNKEKAEWLERYRKILNYSL